MWPCLLSLLMSAVIHHASSGPRYSSRIVHLETGLIRGVIAELPADHMEPVECFLGVRYAAPPVGEYRLRPPRPPLPWVGTRLADTQPPACPQRAFLPANQSAALAVMPRDRYHHLRRLAALLRNQSEDCLTLNVYVPASGSRGEEAPYAIMVFVHGESYEWGGGHVYDVSVWASHSHVIAVTLNYRLGPLGFLKTHPGSKSCCLALRDVEAALLWIRRNIALFGGDPGRVTLLGHGTGAALVNMLLLQDSASGLFHRAVLLSGSLLSPWAVVARPDHTAAQVAAQLNCPHSPDLAECLRRTPLSRILNIDLPSPRFLVNFGPWFSSGPLQALDRAGDSFISRPLLLGLVSTESYLDLNHRQVQYGFEEDQRSKILRTFIHNTFVYHLNELFSTIRNEYIDWDKPIIHPINLRDSTLEALSDGHTVSALVHLAILHSRRGSTTFLTHFNHQPRDTDYIQRLGSVRGEEVPYVLGLPLVGGDTLYPSNYTRVDATVSETMLHFVSNFAKSGDPNKPKYIQNEFGVLRERTANRGVTWEPYNPSTQMYLSLGTKPRMRSHYRAHKMSVWLNLVPQLHRPGTRDVNMRHHYFQERGNDHFDGVLRPEVVTHIPVPTSSSALLPEDCDNTSAPVEQGRLPKPKAENQPSTSPPPPAQAQERGFGSTILAGALLVLLNVAILTGTLYLREWRRSKWNKKPKDTEDISSSTFSKSLSWSGRKTPPTPPLRSNSFHGNVKRVEFLEDEISV